MRFVELQETHDCIYCVVDMHAITVWQDPASSSPATTREVTAAFLAAGIDPKAHIVFNQSQVAVHAELAWVFNCVARMGWLNRMTQFKEKAGKDRENASRRPLRLSDPDGRRHPRLPRHPCAGRRRPEAASRARPRHRHQVQQRFRRIDRRATAIGDAFFPLTEPLITGPATRVMSLRDGTKKMSKSDPSDYSRINLTDDADTIAQKIRKAKTDPEPLPSEVDGLKARPEADNLVGIYAALAGKPKADVLARLRRRAVLGLQAGARRPRGRQARADRRRDAPAPRRPRPHRRRPRRRRRARPRHRREDHGRRQGRGRLRPDEIANGESGSMLQFACRHAYAACAARGWQHASAWPIAKRARSTEEGHRRKFLVVIDDTPECSRALLFAARRAEHTGGALVLLYVIVPGEFQHWVGVENIMRAEAMEEAEEALGTFADIVRAMLGDRAAAGHPRGRARRARSSS